MSYLPAVVGDSGAGVGAGVSLGQGVRGTIRWQCGNLEGQRHRDMLRARELPYDGVIVVVYHTKEGSSGGFGCDWLGRSPLHAQPGRGRLERGERGARWIYHRCRFWPARFAIRDIFHRHGNNTFLLRISSVPLAWISLLPSWRGRAILVMSGACLQLLDIFP